jgi:hypothetical protein
MTFTSTKRFRSSGVAIVAALLGTIGVARAADPSSEERMMPHSIAEMKAMKPSDMAKMMDKDKDGYVTKKEFMEFYEKFFKALDKDHQGKLSTAMFTDQG